MGSLSDKLTSLLNPNAIPSENVIVPDFKIEIIGGQQYGRYILILSGYCLPFQEGITWQTRTQSIKTFYPGNPEASVQIIGPQEGTSTFNFKFDRHRLMARNIPDARTTSIEGSPIRVFEEPLVLCDALESICIKGLELRVTWGALDRRGILTSVDTKPMHEGWVDCSLIFDWHGRGDFVATKIQPPFNWQGAGNTLYSLLTSIVEDLNSAADIAEEFVDDIKSQILQLDSAIQAYTTVIDRFVSLPGKAGRDLAQNIIGIAGTLIVAAIDLRETLEADYSSLCVSNPGDMPSSVNMLRVTSNGQKTAQEMAALAQQIAWEAAALFDGEDMLAVEIATAGVTLMQYAKTYYNDPSLWGVIAKANMIQNPSSVEAGTIIVIPRRTS